MAQPGIDLPYGFKDARVVLLTQAIIGEFFQGGLIFGWNALAIMLKDQGNYNANCPPDLNTRCAWQESHLAVLWTIGVFALNFGPVVVGPILDYVGPKLTAIFGTFLNVLALILLACSNSHDFNALAPGAVILGLAGITFHLSQFHMSNLFPRSRGFISSLLVAGFTGCGAVFYFLDLIFIAAGSTRGAYRLIMILYAVVCSLWMVLNFWMMPWHALQVGQMYLYVGNWKFKVMERKEVERQAVALRMTALDGHGKQPNSPQNGNHQHDMNTVHDLENGHSDEEIDRDMALAYMGLKPTTDSGKVLPDSADPTWLDRESPPTVPITSSDHDSGNHASAAGRDGGEENGRRHSGDEEAQMKPAAAPAQLPRQPSLRPDSATPRGIGRPPVRDHNMLMHGERGALVFEPRRFVELRKKPFWKQFLSSESTGMGIFYTLNVFCIQFYLGTTRLQLEHKGGADHIVTSIANVVPAFGFIGIPVIGWLLDRMGYGITLATINFLGVLASFFQAMPNVWFQIVTLIVWCAGRFFLYTSYYSIFGALFGFTNFGRMVAIDNTINGLVGLLQLPLTNWGLHGLGGNFTAINIIQVAILLPLFVFCWFMYNWETDEADQIPILPVEGEELPCNIKGPRLLREANFLQSLEKKLTGAGAIAA